MRLTVELEGRSTVVDVSDDLATVRVGERSFPLRVVARGPTRVELEIGGETVILDGWPEHQPTPPGPVDLNGERRTVTVRAETRAGPLGSRAAPRAPAPGAGSAAGPPGPSVPAGATPVSPPMPGRVVEVRVHDGDAVARGTVLLVVEAMKMRNEVSAPFDGTVRDVKVREGSSVRARETLLYVVPK